MFNVWVSWNAPLRTPSNDPFKKWDVTHAILFSDILFFFNELFGRKILFFIVLYLYIFNSIFIHFKWQLMHQIFPETRISSLNKYFDHIYNYIKKKSSPFSRLLIALQFYSVSIGTLENRLALLNLVNLFFFSWNITK